MTGVAGGKAPAHVAGYGGPVNVAGAAAPAGLAPILGYTTYPVPHVAGSAHQPPPAATHYYNAQMQQVYPVEDLSALTARLPPMVRFVVVQSLPDCVEADENYLFDELRPD